MSSAKIQIEEPPQTGGAETDHLRSIVNNSTAASLFMLSQNDKGKTRTWPPMFLKPGLREETGDVKTGFGLLSVCVVSF